MGSFPSSYLLQKFILELDGKPVGPISPLSLPAIKGTVVTEPTGFDGHQTKRMVPDAPDELVFSFGPGMSRDIFDWIKQSFKSNYSRKNGSVVVVDQKQVEVQRLDFSFGLISSVKLPKVDKLSRDPAAIEVHLRVEDVKMLGPGKQSSANLYLTGARVPWNLSEFRLRISGLEKESDAVTEVGAIEFKTSIRSDVTGDSRNTNYSPGNSSFGDIEISLPAVSAKTFYDWLEDTVQKGFGDTGERNGSLEYLSPGSKNAYFTLDLAGIGIVSSDLPKGSEQSQLPVKVRLYCESIDFSASSTAVR